MYCEQPKRNLLKKIILSYPSLFQAFRQWGAVRSKKEREKIKAFFTLHRSPLSERLEQAKATRAVPRFQLGNIFYFYKSLTFSLPITPDPLHLVIFIGNTFDLTPIHENFLIASRLKSGTVSLRIRENSQLNHALRKTQTIPCYSIFKDRIVTLIQTPFINEIKKLNLMWCNFIYLFIYSNYLFIRIIVLVISFSALCCKSLLFPCKMFFGIYT